MLSSRSFAVGLIATLFPFLDVPVFWPILLVYWLFLFGVTMHRQIKHMIKYRYLPFDLGKKVMLPPARSLATVTVGNSGATVAFRACPEHRASRVFIQLIKRLTCISAVSSTGPQNTECCFCAWSHQSATLLLTQAPGNVVDLPVDGASTTSPMAAMSIHEDTTMCCCCAEAG
jgi:Rer1 family